MNRSERLTIEDVATLARVSKGTASKALNGRGSLSEDTRARVLAAAQRLEFRPNYLARSLIRGRTFTVGVITSDGFGRFTNPLVGGVEDALGTEQISVFLCNAEGDSMRERQHVTSLLDKRVDGIIVAGRRTDPRPRLQLPDEVPVVYAYAQTDPGLLCLLPDEDQGGYLAGAHLLEGGARRIAHVTGPERFESVRLREAGLRRALAERDLALDPRMVMRGAWSEEWGREAVDRLFESGRPPDAVFCGSDQIARGVCDRLRDRAVEVPGDVSVVGFDNWEIVAAATRPPLTTVDPNIHELGRMAGKRLIEMIDGDPQSGIDRLPCRLVVRASTVHSA
jgi:LacI family transcriptional regulator